MVGTGSLESGHGGWIFPWRLGETPAGLCEDRDGAQGGLLEQGLGGADSTLVARSPCLWDEKGGCLRGRQGTPEGPGPQDTRDPQFARFPDHRDLSSQVCGAGQVGLCLFFVFVPCSRENPNGPGT